MAGDLDADLLIIATDVDGVYLDWGTDNQRKINKGNPEALEELGLAAGSMGPKVEAAARFVRQSGKRAAIGSLDQLPGLVAGTEGTIVTTEIDGIE